MPGPLVSLALLLTLGIVYAKSEINCAVDKYPPGLDTHVPKYVINLDLPPEERWDVVGMDKKEEVKNVIGVIVKLTEALVGDKLINFVNKYFPILLKTLPEPYASEIKGLALATEIPVGEIVLYNVFYELFTVCTSIVAQNEQGNLVHGRNLDFGLFMGWDVHNHTWALTEALRQTVVEFDFQRGNTTVYRSASYVGYVGIMTAMKPKLFTLTTDERFNANGGFIGIAEWILGDRSQAWLGFTLRDVMEKANSYEEAKLMLYKTKLLAPAYFILGGNKSGQACVLTKERNTPEADVWTMSQSGFGWFIVETNYDHWKNPPFYDDRRTSAVTCLKKTTQANATFSGLFNVLSTQPNFNKLTTYTALMDANNDAIEVYLQNCKDPKCAPF